MNHDNEIHFFRKIPDVTTTNALKWNYADTLMQFKVITVFAYKLFNPRAKPKAMLAARHVFATRYGSEGMQFVTPVYPSSCVCLVILSQFLLDSVRFLRDSSAGKSRPFWIRSSDGRPGDCHAWWQRLCQVKGSQTCSKLYRDCRKQFCKIPCFQEIIKVKIDAYSRVLICHWNPLVTMLSVCASSGLRPN